MRSAPPVTLKVLTFVEDGLFIHSSAFVLTTVLDDGPHLSGKYRLVSFSILLAGACRMPSLLALVTESCAQAPKPGKYFVV